jgi:hypothetical protein
LNTRLSDLASLAGRFLAVAVILSLLMGLCPARVVNAADPLTVSLGVPAGVKSGHRFDVLVKISAVNNLAAWGFELTYNNAVIQVDGLQGDSAGVSAGYLGDTELPIYWSSFGDENGGHFGEPVTSNAIRVGGNLDPRFPVTWTGQDPSYIAVVHFKVLNNVAHGTVSSLAFSNCLLGDQKANPISPVSWLDGSVKVDNIAPAAPNGLKLAGAVNGAAYLSWKANSDDATAYRVYCLADNGTTWWDGVEVQSGTYFTYRGLTNGLTYRLAVTAIDAAGNESNKSIQLTATPLEDASAASRLVFATSAQTLVAGTVSEQITCQAVDISGQPAPLLLPVVIDLNTTSTTGRFDNSPGGLFDGSCTSISIAAGASAAGFYYRDLRTGAPELTLSNNDFNQDQQTVTVIAASGCRLIWESPPPVRALAGAAWPDFSLKVIDFYGNQTSDNATITILATGGLLNGSLAEDADSGLATFEGISCASPGHLRLSATGANLSPAPEAAMTIYPALQVAGYPSPVMAGEVGYFSVFTVDKDGNPVTGYTGKVHFTSSDPQAVLPADSQFYSWDQGMKNYSAVFNTAGWQTLTATDIAASDITGTQSEIEVNPAINVVRSFPSPVTYGQTFNVSLDFSVMANDFDSISLFDLAPSGWAVAVDNSWNTPPSAFCNTAENQTMFIWNGPFASGTTFKAVYKVTVPYGIAEGSYNFGQGRISFQLEYSGFHIIQFTDDAGPTVFAGATIEGGVFESNGFRLSKATVTLDESTQLIISDNESWQFGPLQLGTHKIEAASAGYRYQTQSLEVTDPAATYTLDFKGDSSLTPLAPDAAYVATCGQKWQNPPSDGTELSMAKLLGIIHAWKYPSSAPTVVSVSPLGANIPLDSVVTIRFSQPMQPATLNTGSFTLTAGGESVVGAVTYDDNTSTATFTPDAGLEYSTQYTATVTPDAKDVANNCLGENYDWSFTTRASPIKSVFPTPASTGVSISTNVVCVFSQSMDYSTIDNSSFILRQGDQVIPGDVHRYDTQDTAFFVPFSALNYETLYTATLTTAVTDLQGYRLAHDFSWSFTTGPEESPCLVSIGGPSTANAGDTLDITINISEVTGLGTWQLWLKYDPGVLQVIGREGSKEGVSRGLVGSTSLPVGLWAFSPVGQPGEIGITGIIYSPVSGSGYLMQIHFKVIGAPGTSSALSFWNVKLFNDDENMIPTILQDGSLTVN